MDNVVSGTVRDSSGHPVAQARVAFTEAPVPVPEIAALTDNRGVFYLSAPVAGTYKIGCYADGFEPAETRFTVQEGQETQLDIRLKQ